jgi:hypothetical protein
MSGQRHAAVLIDSHPSAALLVDAADNPVWPVRTVAEAEAVRTAAATWDVPVIETRSVPGLNPRTTDEVVLSVGEGTAPAAELYAHLSGRRVRHLTSFRALREHLPSVVITLWPLVTPDVLEQLYPLRGGAPVTGLILAVTPADLHLLVLTRAVSAQCRPYSPATRLDVLPQLAIGQLSATNRRVFGKDAAPTALRDALQSGGSVVTVVSHSDGVDGKLSDTAVLCPMTGPVGACAPQPAPRCIVTHHCHRQDRPVADALASGDLISPQALSVRVLIWACCFGTWPLPNIDPAWSLMRRIASSPRVGAVITSWELVLSAPSMVEPLAAAIAAGVPIGVAMRRFRRLRSVQQRALRLCLLGDPRACAGPQRTVVASVMPQETAFAGGNCRDRPAPPVVRELSVLRAFFAGLSRYPTPDLERVASTARDAVERYAAHVQAVNRPDAAEADAATMRRTVLEYLGARDFAHWMEGWLAHAGRTTVGVRPCRSCGGGEVVLRVRLKMPDAVRRVLGRCPRCGAVNDEPYGRRFNLRIDTTRVLSLEGPAPRSHWDAGVLFSAGMSKTPTTWVPWPADATGRPQRSFRIDRPLPPGPLFATLVMVWKTQTVVLTRVTRGDDPLAHDGVTPTPGRPEALFAPSGPTGRRRRNARCPARSERSRRS